MSLLLQYQLSWHLRDIFVCMCTLQRQENTIELTPSYWQRVEWDRQSERHKTSSFGVLYSNRSYLFLLQISGRICVDWNEREFDKNSWIKIIICFEWCRMGSVEYSGGNAPKTDSLLIHLQNRIAEYNTMSKWIITLCRVNKTHIYFRLH